MKESVAVSQQARSPSAGDMLPTELASWTDYAAMVAERQFDFLDIGASAGGSMKYAQRKFQGTRGLGIDIDEKKVSQARAAGHEVCIGNAAEIELPRNCVRFVICNHVLEHLPNRASAQKVLNSAIVAARNFVLVRVPYFDADGMLAHKGLKFYHSDWSGHTNRLTALDFYFLARNGNKRKVKEVFLYGRNKISAEDSTFFVPLDAPINTTAIQAKAFELAMPSMAGLPLFKELLLLVRLSNMEDPQKWQATMERRCNVEHENLLFQYAPAAIESPPAAVES